MRKSLLCSLLVHTAVLAVFAWHGPAEEARSAPAVAFALAPAEPPAEPEPAPAEPTLPAAPEAAVEEWEPEEAPAEPRFGELPPRVAPPPQTAGPRGLVRLPKPLRREESGPAAKAAAAPAPPAPPAPAAASVTTAPAPKKNDPPEYPAVARRMGQEGTVKLRLRIDREGAVTDAEIVRGSGHRLLDKAALKAARGWTFAPATRDGEPVPGEFVQPVEFRLE